MMPAQYAAASATETTEGLSLYEELGGLSVLQRAHKIFYDKIYRHPWLRLFFAGVSQILIENQQTDFMAQAMGGPSRYSGKLPVPAHRHMFITEELFETRGQLLEASLIEAGVSTDLRARWLKIDRAFKGRLVKRSEAECEGRYKTEPIMVIPKPSA